MGIQGNDFAGSRLEYKIFEVYLRNWCLLGKNSNSCSEYFFRFVFVCVGRFFDCVTCKAQRACVYMYTRLLTHTPACYHRFSNWFIFTFGIFRVFLSILFFPNTFSLWSFAFVGVLCSHLYALTCVNITFIFESVYTIFLGLSAQNFMCAWGCNVFMRILCSCQ